MPLIEVKIPPMGESISSGVIAKWHVVDGDLVRKDQPLFELETDKITIEGAAESAGRIALKAAKGANVKIGEVVATIDSSEGAAGAPAAKPEPAAAEHAPAAVQSPAVRRLAGETGVNPDSISGTGKAGRVTKGDMLAAAESAPSSPAASTAERAAERPAASNVERQTRRKLSPLRQRIAQRLVAAQQEAAMLTTFNEVDMSAVMALRAKYQ